MIRNLIFDMGDVLIEFDPPYFLDREQISDQEDRELLLREVFYSPCWKDMDLGLYDENEMFQRIKANIPERLMPAAERLMFHLHDPLIPVKGMDELVMTLKEKGYKIYLLSNASVRQKRYWPQVRCSSCFDGTVVSAFEKCIKPDPRIYEILLDRYALKAEESLFIDDRLINTEAAQKLGMKAFLFQDNCDELVAYMKKEGIL